MLDLLISTRMRISIFFDFWLLVFYKFKSLNKPEDKNVIPERYFA